MFGGEVKNVAMVIADFLNIEGKYELKWNGEEYFLSNVSPKDNVCRASYYIPLSKSEPISEGGSCRLTQEGKCQDFQCVPNAENKLEFPSDDRINLVRSALRIAGFKVDKSFVFNPTEVQLREIEELAGEIKDADVKNLEHGDLVRLEIEIPSKITASSKKDGGWIIYSPKTVDLTGQILMIEAGFIYVRMEKPTAVCTCDEEKIDHMIWGGMGNYFYKFHLEPDFDLPCKTTVTELKK